MVSFLVFAYLVLGWISACSGRRLDVDLQHLRSNASTKGYSPKNPENSASQSSFIAPRTIVQSRWQVRPRRNLIHAVVATRQEVREVGREPMASTSPFDPDHDSPSSEAHNITNVAETKASWLKLIPMIRSDEDHAEVERLAKVLESTYSPINSIGFLNLVLQGSWDFLHTTSPLPLVDPRLRLRRLAQLVQPSTDEAGSGNITLEAIWQFSEGSQPCIGLFTVRCPYKVTTSGDVKLENATEPEYILEPREGPKLNNPQELVVLLQRAIPREMFEPEGATQHIAFMDDSLRITYVFGGKHPAARHIHLKSESIGDSR